MKTKRLIIIALVFLVIHPVRSQSIENIKQINGIWVKFCQAFDSSDYESFNSIHSTEVMRISSDANRIMLSEDYMNANKEYFNNFKNNNIKCEISLRFFERMNNDSFASERGIYKFIFNKGTEKEQIYYGKFHALLVKENGVWRILMDYDSNENNSITGEDYNNAYAMDDFEKFIGK